MRESRGARQQTSMVRNCLCVACESEGGGVWRDVPCPIGEGVHKSRVPSVANARKGDCIDNVRNDALRETAMGQVLLNPSCDVSVCASS